MQKTDPKTLLLRMGNANRKRVGVVSMKILDRLQDNPADEQVAATAIIFLRMCQKAHIHPSEILSIAANIHTDGERVHPELRCIDRYIESQF